MLKFICSNSKALFSCLTQLPSEYIHSKGHFVCFLWIKKLGGGLRDSLSTPWDATGQAEMQGDPTRGSELEDAREPLQQTSTQQWGS